MQLIFDAYKLQEVIKKLSKFTQDAVLLEFQPDKLKLTTADGYKYISTSIPLVCSYQISLTVNINQLKTFTALKDHQAMFELIDKSLFLSNINTKNTICLDLLEPRDYTINEPAAGVKLKLHKTRLKDCLKYLDNEALDLDVYDQFIKISDGSSIMYISQRKH